MRAALEGTPPLQVLGDRLPLVAVQLEQRDKLDVLLLRPEVGSLFADKSWHGGFELLLLEFLLRWCHHSKLKNQRDLSRLALCLYGFQREEGLCLSLRSHQLFTELIKGFLGEVGGSSYLLGGFALQVAEVLF